MIGASSNGVAIPDWFGSGEDGDLIVAENETKIIDVDKDSGQVFLQLKNLTINTGGVLKPSNRCNGMVLLVRGNFTLNGTILMDKMAPCSNDRESICASVPQIRIVGDFKGGNGGKGGSGYTDSASDTSVLGGPTLRTQGGVGGAGVWSGGGNGGGGGASGFLVRGGGSADDRFNKDPVADGSSGDRPHSDVGLPYINPSSSYNSSGAYGTGGNAAEGVRGGAAPGGGGGFNYYSKGLTQYGYYWPNRYYNENGIAGDAYGGGAVWIFVKGTVTIGAAGVISADGGNGADGVTASSDYPSSGAGGGGGGGIIVLIHNGDITNNGSIHANAGRGGVKSTRDTSYSSDDATNGSGGAIGTVVVKSLQEIFNS